MAHVLAIHGGAGAMDRDDFDATVQDRVHDGLRDALTRGDAVLRTGGDALQAVIEAVACMEDCADFNAGRGAVLNRDGEVELDAAVMRGSDRAAGAVAGVRRIANPVRLARLVMEQTPHVMLQGEGAERFYASLGLAFVANERLVTDARRAQWRESGGAPGLDHDRHGTVGAVAWDGRGVAAATSTGGMVNKLAGRVGDSPIIGAGTYANARCAVSATGHGEFFIRYVAAHAIAARVADGATLEAAAGAVLAEIETAGGAGGVVAVDAAGRVAMPYTTPGMYRGYVDATGIARTAIFAAFRPTDPREPR